jgi:hypothetical protein
MCIFYGDTQPFGYVSVFARIVSRVEDLQAVGERLLSADLLLAHLKRLTEQDGGDSAGSSPFTHLRSGSWLGENFYEQALHEPAYSTSRVLGELRAYMQRYWEDEPADIVALRSVSRPPMGKLPCDFYANFNLFWAGENLQVCRQMVQDTAMPVQMVGLLAAGLLERHAARLEKWLMLETVDLERMLAEYFRRNGPANREEFLAVLDHALLALDRTQSWIDALLLWSNLDTHLMLRRPIASFEK